VFDRISVRWLRFAVDVIVRINPFVLYLTKTLVFHMKLLRKWFSESSPRGRIDGVS
jgi:hypothetical protein